MPSPQTAIVLGITADIGRGLTKHLLRDGWRVIGIGRALDRVDDLHGTPNLDLYRCDAASADSVKALATTLRDGGVGWDLLLSSVGTMEPIGPFFDLDFEAWARSVDVNFTDQLRVLHALWPLRRPGKAVDIMLMAGGGTNNPFRNYSAYCVSKIALIKMCELIDDEATEANAFIIGPGYTKTRIHEETLRAGPKSAGDGYYKTLALLENQGTTIDEIYDHMRWCMAQGREVAGGRNFSTVHDAWRDGGLKLANALAADQNAFRLRRRQVS
jgi:NAD(P)-dependent dehydrogenase (short-subunit alcohol dehydrogenase family)